MDSLTQIVLGAAVGEAVLGKKIGNRAQLIGAIAGTIPDLDVLLTVYFHDDLTELRIHRSYSHALLTHFLLAFPLAWLTHIYYKKRIKYSSWYLLWFLGLATHAILDSFTTYGTRLFLPFTEYLVGFNNISVIDPLYTLPFMGMLIYCMCIKRDNPRRLIWAKRAIYISSGYMALTFVMKFYQHKTFESNLQKQQISYNTLSTSPSIFNNILWAGIAYNDSTLEVGEHSALDNSDPIKFSTYNRNLKEEKDFEGEELNTLKWFSQGLYFVERKDSVTLNFYIAKYGKLNFSKNQPEKAFVYYTMKKGDGKIKVNVVMPDFKETSVSEAFSQLWHRMLGEKKF